MKEEKGRRRTIYYVTFMRRRNNREYEEVKVGIGINQSRKQGL
jgi:hypothetical protein